MSPERERKVPAKTSSDRHAAFAMLDRGELRGTIAQAEFSMLRAMLAEMSEARIP